MTDALRLQEHGQVDLRLEESTAVYLERAYEHALDVRMLGVGLYRVTAKSHVGVIVAPRLEILITPKCGLANTMAMIGWAYDLAAFRDERTLLADVKDFREALVALFLTECERLLRQGIRRGYGEREDDLVSMRGRLRVDAHARRGPGSAWRLPCRFEEFTGDVPFNQVLRYTLEQIGPPPAPRFASRLQRLRHLLQELSLVRFRPSDIEAFSYDRLNEHYRPVHALCRLILEARGVELEQGSMSTGSLLVDMNRLFEAFLARWLQAHLRAPWSLRSQWQSTLDQGQQVAIRPDLVLLREGRPVLVADTKYKVDKVRPSREDAYQALAYCRGLGVRQCVLIYPDLGRDGSRVTVRDGENAIGVAGIPLGRSWAEVLEAMEGLARELVRSGEETSSVGEACV